MLTLGVRGRCSTGGAALRRLLGTQQCRLAHKKVASAAEKSIVETARVKIQETLCQTRYVVVTYLNLWSILRRLGISNCRIVRFRRQLRRFQYPWMAYSVPSAFGLMTGDLIAQIFIEKKKKLEDINLCRTVHYGLISFIIIGPISSKMFLMWYRRAGRGGGQLVRMTKSIFLDVFIVTPILVSSILVAYDYKFMYEFLKNVAKKSKEKKLDGRKELDKVVERYKKPFKEDMTLYLQTKPLISLAACFLVAPALRVYLRQFYYVGFYAYVSNRNFKYKLGPEIQKYKSGGKNSDGSGGPACMLKDAIFSKADETGKKAKGKSK